MSREQSFHSINRQELFGVTGESALDLHLEHMGVFLEVVLGLRLEIPVSNWPRLKKRLGPAAEKRREARQD